MRFDEPPSPASVALVPVSLLCGLDNWHERKFLCPRAPVPALWSYLLGPGLPNLVSQLMSFCSAFAASEESQGYFLDRKLRPLSWHQPRGGWNKELRPTSQPLLGSATREALKSQVYCSVSINLTCTHASILGRPKGPKSQWSLLKKRPKSANSVH